MPKETMIVDLDMSRQQILNFSLQNLSTFPPTINAEGVSLIPGAMFWHNVDNVAYVWTGVSWINFLEVYTHPIFPGNAFPTNPLTGANVITQIKVNNGHVIGYESRTISLSDLGAASVSHTHAFSEIVGLPANTILANNTGSQGPAKAITVADFLVLIGIAYGSFPLLSTGADTEQRTWTSKQLNDWMTSKLSTYLTQVNLSYTASQTQGSVNSSAGSSAIIPAGSQSNASLMLPSDKVKIDNIEAGANNYVHPDYFVGPNDFETELLNGLKVISQVITNIKGHVVSIKGRNLTSADIASVMINDAINNGTLTTWSSSKIHQEIADAIGQAQTGALIYQPTAYVPSTAQGQVIQPSPQTSTSIKAGMVWVVSTLGWFGNEEVDPGDMIIAKIDNAGINPNNYQTINKNIPAIVDATTSVKGIVQLATITDYNNNDNTKAVTPLLLRTILDERVGGYTTLFGNGSATSFVFTHNLGTRAVIAAVMIESTGEYIRLKLKAATNMTVTADMNIAPSQDAYRFIVKK